MTAARARRCAVYALIGLVALVGTWGNNLRYLPLGFVGANARFWTDTTVNPASRSITVDLMFLMLAVVVWMVREARRLRLKGVWLYVVFGALVAISAAVPAFLIHREWVLAARDGAEDPDDGRLLARDVVGLVALALPMLAYTAIGLGR